MAVERNLHLSLIVALSAILLCRAAEIRDPIRPSTESRGHQEEKKTSSFPVELLGSVDETNVAVVYGISLFEDVSSKLAECREERRKILAKVNKQSSSLHEYYDTLRPMLEKPKFEELVHENKVALESNFEKAFEELEHSRERKLEKQKEKCNKEMDTLVETKVHEASTYAGMLVIQDPKRFESLTLEASAFGTQLRGALAECSSHRHVQQEEDDVQADSHGEMSFDLCRRYFVVIERLIDFIDWFLTHADELTRRYLYPDDEDYDYPDELEGSGEYDNDHDKKQPEDLHGRPSPLPAVPESHPPDNKGQVPISSFFEPGPVIIEPPKPDDGGRDEVKTKPPATEPLITDSLEQGTVVIIDPTKPGDGKEEETKIPDDKKPTISTPDMAPPTKSDVAPPTTQKPEDVDYHYDGGDEKVTGTATPTLSPGDLVKEESTPDTKTTHEYPTWVDEAFDYILHHDDKKDEEVEHEDDKDFKTADFSRSKSTNEEEEPDIQGSIDVQLPGVDVEIDENRVDIEDDNGQVLSIMFDDDQADATEETSSEDEDNSFIEYMLIYFFATLGCLLVLTIIVLSIAIIALRTRSRTPKDTPLLSEDDKIAVMKQTGYVNPTYKFFDHVKEV